MGKLDLYCGDCLEVMKNAPDNSIDAIVTDPPYGLSFMGKKWDYDVPSVEIWRECFRVLKPGGHLLAFGGTRTYHRLAVNVEDAGFEIRDQIQWLYGQGFPKSLDVSKAIDKAAGAEREIVGRQNYSAPDIRGNSYDQPHVADRERLGVAITAPTTDAAKQWEGWGTALKPANEPIVLARKPLEKGLTVAQNVQKWGTGAINVDGCRVGLESNVNLNARQTTTKLSKEKFFDAETRPFEGQQTYNPIGRFPANIILDEVAAEMLDEQTQYVLPPWGRNSTKHSGQDDGNIYSKGLGNNSENERFKDGIGASRFFYCAKASTSERNAGLDGMPEKDAPQKYGLGDSNGERAPHKHTPRANVHPTVKPVKLMEYLVRLITPPGGIVLDPFMGSGTTGIAAGNEGMGFVGIELSPEYFEIAKRRIGLAE